MHNNFPKSLRQIFNNMHVLQNDFDPIIQLIIQTHNSQIISLLHRRKYQNTYKSLLHVYNWNFF